MASLMPLCTLPAAYSPAVTSGVTTGWETLDVTGNKRRSDRKRRDVRHVEGCVMSLEREHRNGLRTNRDRPITLRLCGGRISTDPGSLQSFTGSPEGVGEFLCARGGRRLPHHDRPSLQARTGHPDTVPQHRKMSVSGNHPPTPRALHRTPRTGQARQPSRESS